VLHHPWRWQSLPTVRRVFALSRWLWCSRAFRSRFAWCAVVRSCVRAGARRSGCACGCCRVVVGLPAFGWGGALVVFPLSGAVAVVGSRHGSPYPVAPVVAAILAAGGSVRTGCARGVDSLAAALAPGCVVLRAVNFPASTFAASLALRTAAVVRGASAVCVFPSAGGIGSGSALAIRTALAAGLPVFVAGVCPSAGTWQPCIVSGVSGWCAVSQPSLF
jgi:hypothetical protein